jgi:hypothetical protein
MRPVWSRTTVCAAFALLAAVASSCANRSTPFTAVQSGGNPDTFAPPNVLAGASFESGWDGFVNAALQGTPTGVSRDCTLASTGRCSIRRSWSPSAGDVGSQFLFGVGLVDHVWVRFYFRLTAPITTIMKFARFYDGSIATNFGGLFLRDGNDIVTFGTDQENQSITVPIGLTQSRVIDGQWHSLEFEYWRNGDPSGFPSAAFWFDGSPVSMADGPAGMSMFWRGGRLYAGTRTTSKSMSFMEWAGTLNGGNSTSGQVNLDNVAISTAGRIGP